jgi:hypothetical protein
VSAEPCSISRRSLMWSIASYPIGSGRCAVSRPGTNGGIWGRAARASRPARARQAAIQITSRSAPRGPLLSSPALPATAFRARPVSPRAARLIAARSVGEPATCVCSRRTCRRMPPSSWQTLARVILGTLDHVASPHASLRAMRPRVRRGNAPPEQACGGEARLLVHKPHDDASTAGCGKMARVPECLGNLRLGRGNLAPLAT